MENVGSYMLTTPNKQPRVTSVLVQLVHYIHILLYYPNITYYWIQGIIIIYYSTLWGGWLTS